MRSSNLAHESTHFPSILGVTFAEEMMDVQLSDGRTISVPLAWYPRLVGATPSQLKNLAISPGGYGIHWPELDEDLSVKGFLLP